MPIRFHRAAVQLQAAGGPSASPKCRAMLPLSALLTLDLRRGRSEEAGEDSRLRIVLGDRNEQN